MTEDDHDYRRAVDRDVARRSREVRPGHWSLPAYELVALSNPEDDRASREATLGCAAFGVGCALFIVGMGMHSIWIIVAGPLLVLGAPRLTRWMRHRGGVREYLHVEGRQRATVHALAKMLTRKATRMQRVELGLTHAREDDGAVTTMRLAAD